MQLHSCYEQKFEFAEHGFDKVHCFYVLKDGYLWCLNEYSFEDADHEVSGWRVKSDDPEATIASAVLRGGEPLVRLEGDVEWLAFQKRVAEEQIVFVEYSRVNDPNALDEEQFQELFAG
jgi:hypothetical protein